MDNLKRKNALEINLKLLTVTDLKKTENKIFKQSQLESLPAKYYSFADREAGTGGDLPTDTVDLSIDKSILLLRSFICRRGHPSRINSDNRKNFAQVKGI